MTRTASRVVGTSVQIVAPFATGSTSREFILPFHCFWISFLAPLRILSRAAYPGASPVAQRLFTYWFDEDHLIDGESFRFYFGQREAIETLVYLTEFRKERGCRALVHKFGEIFYPQGTQAQLVGTDIEHQTSMDGKNQIRRYIPEIDAITIQDLPDGNLSRHAFKMATGSGKTIVMAMAIVWSFFHKRMVNHSPLCALLGAV